MRVVWSREALHDLQANEAYIGRDNPRAARAVTLQIERAATVLELFPEAGRALLRGRARVLIEARYRYKLVYEVDRASDLVRILRVFHPARDRP